MNGDQGYHLPLDLRNNRGFRIPGTGLKSFWVELGFWIPPLVRLYSGFQSPGSWPTFRSLTKTTLRIITTNVYDEEIRMGPIALRNFQEIFGVEDIFSVIESNPNLLLRRFVLRMVESSAKLERLVMNRKGPWKGYSCLLPVFFCAHIFIEKERRLGTRQVVSSRLKLEKMSPWTKQTVRIKRVYVKRGFDCTMSQQRNLYSVKISFVLIIVMSDIIIIITCLNRMTISVIKTAINMGPLITKALTNLKSLCSGSPR